MEIVQFNDALTGNESRSCELEGVDKSDMHQDKTNSDKDEECKDVGIDEGGKKYISPKGYGFYKVNKN